MQKKPLFFKRTNDFIRKTLIFFWCAFKLFVFLLLKLVASIVFSAFM